MNRIQVRVNLKSTGDKEAVETALLEIDARVLFPVEREALIVELPVRRIHDLHQIRGIRSYQVL